MALSLNKNMKYTLGQIQKYSRAQVNIRIRKPLCLDISPGDIELVYVNGFSNPLSFSHKVLRQCDCLYNLVVEQQHLHDNDEINELICKISDHLPPLSSTFYFMSFPVFGYKSSWHNTRCMFKNVYWDDGQEVDEENDHCDKNLHLLLDMVEKTLQPALWPYAQVVFTCLSILYQKLRLLALTECKIKPSVNYFNVGFSDLKLASVGEMNYGLIGRPEHIFGVPFLIAN